MGQAEPFDERPVEERDLLAKYEMERAKRSYAPKLIAGGLLILCTFITFHEMATRGSSVMLMIEGGVLILGLAVAMMFAMSGIAFWLAWNFGGHQLKKGTTRPQVRHLVVFMAYALFLSLPFGAMAFTTPQDWLRPVVVCLLFFWNGSTSAGFGYLSRFLADGKKLL